MKKLLLLSVLCAGVLLSSATYADYTANDLLKFCKGVDRFIDGNENPGELALSGACMGYINGIMAGYEGAVSDANIVYKQKHGPDPYGRDLVSKPWNIPAGVTHDMIVKVVIKYLENHPENLHELSATHVLRAIVQAYPRVAETP